MNKTINSAAIADLVVSDLVIDT